MFLKVSLVFVLIASVYVQFGDAIHCWFCNTDRLDKCGDPFNATQYSPRLRSLLVDCGTQSYTNIQRSLRGMRWVCRKAQYKSAQGRSTTVRGCFSINIDAPTGDCLDTFDSNHIKTEFCELCDDRDGCNSAPSLTYSTMAIISLIAIFVLIF